MFGLPAPDKRRRYREVASVLARHGLGFVSSELGLGWLVPFNRGLLGHAKRKEPYTPAEHVRMAIEDLGTTAIKLGQILSTRPDLIPPEFSQELVKLRDRVPPVPTPAMIDAVERELCCEAAEIFENFDERPLAAASIGQVHGATLRDGTRVVVKVRKPGVTEAVASDLAILADLARRAAHAQLVGENYDLEALADEFAWTLRAELDYVREGRNADRLRTILAAEPRVVIPRIHWRLTTREILVMDRIEGITIDDIEGLDKAGIARPPLARLSAEVLMRQVFEAGFFHADAHPGNFLVLADGRIALLDFGMVGDLHEDLRQTILELLTAMARQDALAMVDGLEAIGVVRSPSIRESLRRDLRHLLDRYYGLAVSEFDLREYLADLLAIVRRHQLVLPPELSLVLKTLAMSEGLWRELDPQFNLTAVAEPLIKAALARSYSPSALGERLLRTTGEAAQLAANLPGQVRRLAARLDRGELELTLRHRDIQEALERLSDMTTRLATAIIAAALILGLPVLATVHEPPGWRYVAPLTFFAGLTLIVSLLARNLISRRNRRR